MWDDPIVKEVRESGEELVKQAHYDLHEYFQLMRIKESTGKYGAGQSRKKAAKPSVKKSMIK